MRRSLYQSRRGALVGELSPQFSNLVGLRPEYRAHPQAWRGLARVYAQPSSFIANPACQILVMCAILSPSNCMT